MHEPGHSPHARGLMRVGDSMTHASVIGNDGRIVRELDFVGARAILPAIRGTAWITSNPVGALD